MPGRQKILAKVLWVFAISIGVTILVLGPVSALRALTPASGATLTSPAPIVGSMLSPAVAMGVALFGLGLIIVDKGYSKIRFRATAIET